MSSELQFYTVTHNNIQSLHIYSSPLPPFIAEGNLLTLELKDIFTRCTTDVIATTAFGLKVDSLQQPTNKFYVMGQEATNFGLMKWFVVLAFPKIVKVSQDTVSENSSQFSCAS
jgi:hypothetical protein